MNLSENDGKKKYGEGVSDELQHTTSSVKHGAGSVTACVGMAASGSGSLGITDEMAADGSGRMNCELCGAKLYAPIQPNASEPTG